MISLVGARSYIHLARAQPASFSLATAIDSQGVSVLRALYVNVARISNVICAISEFANKFGWWAIRAEHSEQANDRGRGENGSFINGLPRLSSNRYSKMLCKRSEHTNRQQRANLAIQGVRYSKDPVSRLCIVPYA